MFFDLHPVKPVAPMSTDSDDDSSRFTPLTQSPPTTPLTQSPPRTPPRTPPVMQSLLLQHPASWHENMGTHLFEAGQSLRRLEQLKQRMEQSPHFDDDDCLRVTQASHVVENRVESLHRMLTKHDFKVVRLFVTLKHREHQLETAVKEGLLSIQEDTQLFQALVKKQVYLTRLAHNQAGEVKE
jgi:hypothetical protein